MIRFLLILLVMLLTLDHSRSLFAMAQAHAVQPERIFIPLKNGGIAPAISAFNTHLSVCKIVASNGGFAVRELIETCRSNTQQSISLESAAVLRPYGLITHEFKAKPELVDIILSMARGEDDKLAIINPEKFDH